MACNRDKETYVSRSDATKVIAGINAAADKRKRASMKAYFCEDCNGWHLTTTNKRKIKPYRGGTGVVEVSTKTHTRKGRKKNTNKNIIIRTNGSFKVR